MKKKKPIQIASYWTPGYINPGRSLTGVRAISGMGRLGDQVMHNAFLFDMGLNKYGKKS